MNEPASARPDRSADDRDDAAIDSEWRKIEAERIAEEREEAREDLLDAQPQKPRWPWLALAGALVAGLVAAVVLNSPAAVSRRMVAPPTEPPAPQRATPLPPPQETPPPETPGPSPESLEE